MSKLTKESIESALGGKYPDILEILNQDSINFNQTNNLFGQIQKNNPKDAKMLFMYRMLVEKSFDATYPEDPFYPNFYTETEEDVENFTKNLKAQWEKQKEQHFKKSKNVIYDNMNYFYDIMTSPKQPVIGDRSLGQFLEKTKYRIQKSNGSESPDLDDLTFIQPMYCEDKNGNIIRLIRVVELRPYNKNVYSKELDQNIPVPTFNFSISYKIMPDDNLNHATCLLRIDSDKSFHKDLHFHFFNKDVNFAYLGKPLSTEPITLNDIVGISKQGENQKRNLDFNLEAISLQKTDIKNLATTLHLAEKRLKGEKTFDRKEAWLTQLFALKIALNLTDKAYQVSEEVDIDTLQQKVFGSYYEASELIEKPAEIKKPQSNYKFIKMPNEVRGKGHGKEKERKEQLKQRVIEFGKSMA